MSDEHEHRAQAKHNRQFAAFLLNQGSYTDWAVTACFYAALHLIDAVLARFLSYNPTDYYQRESKMSRFTRIPQEVINAYHCLKDVSMDARYDCLRPAVEDIRTTYLPELDKIERFVRQELN
jgi:HEPN domain-containing protein